MSEEVIGRNPSPRILIRGFTEEAAAGLAAIAPTVGRVDHPDEVRQEEWDLLVTDRNVPRDLSKALFVLTIGADEQGFPDDLTDLNGQTSYVAHNRMTLATEFVVEPGLPPAIDALVRRSLVPTAQLLAKKRLLKVIHEEWRLQTLRFGPTPPAVKPFLRTTEGLAIAGRFERRGGAAECWVLPFGCEPVEWTRVMLDFLSARDPARFPRAADWTLDRRWWTDAEEAAQERLRQVVDDRDQAMAAAERLVGEAEETAAQATQQAIIGERRLLSAQGHELLQAVTQALEQLGFAVEARDEQAAEGDLLEDLRVRDAEFPDWVAIAEVRGYRRGAQLADLNRLHARFRLRFVQEMDKLPDAMWYVVNHSIGTDPGTRQPALGSHPAGMELFAEDGGLVIESQFLYDLWMQVRKGAMTKDEGRLQIRESVGRFGTEARAS